MNKKTVLSFSVIAAVSFVLASSGITTVFAQSTNTFNINVVCSSGQQMHKSVKSSTNIVSNINISCGGNGQKGPKGDPGVPGQNGQRGPPGPAATICIQTANFTCPIVTINSTNTNNNNDTALTHGSSMSNVPLIPK